MGYKPSNEEISYMRELLEKHPTYLFLINKSNLIFTEGDVLIKKNNRSWSDELPEWEYETISSANSMLKRYVYVYKDPATEIGFIRPLKLDGKLGDEIIMTTNFDPKYCQFEIDPIFSDSILLGDGSFDIKSLAKDEKERKKSIVAYNTSISAPSTKISEVNHFLSNLSVGSSFHCSNAVNFLGLDVETFKVLSINKKFISGLTQFERSVYEKFINDKNVCDVKSVMVLSIDRGWGQPVRWSSLDFIGMTLYKSKPKNLFDRNETM